MSVRSSIGLSLVDIFNTNLNGATNPYTSNIYNNAHKKLVFWDEVADFPYISIVPGPETREYLPSQFKWGYLNVTLRIYVSDATDPSQVLESLLEDIEKLLDANREIPYTSVNGTTSESTDLRIISITTDEGLLEPYGVGEVSIEVQYQVL